jgi:chromosome segregation ATPase
MFLKSWVACFAVESARSQQCQEAFGSFVKELRKLAERVAGLGETISEQTQAIRSPQTHGLQTIVSSLSELDKLARDLEGTANITAAEAQQILDGSCATLEAVEAHSRQVALHAGEAVYYMQFGDITRQKLEHVSLALEEAAQAAATAASEGEFRVKAAELECVAAIQAGQVESVRAELQTAQSKLKLAFEGIADHTSRLAQAFGQSEEPAHGHSSANDALQSLERDLRRALELHQAGGEVQRHARNAAREAEQGCTQLAQCLAQVSAFNRDMHLQALNASIKTAALGQQGATLDVLSMRMGWLYGESNREVEGIIATIQMVLDQAKDDVADSASVGSPADAGPGLPSGIERIARVQAEFAQTATEASSLATRQRTSLARSDAVIEFLKNLEGVLATHWEDLNSLRKDLGSIKSAGASGSQALASLGQRYTMQEEREIHQRVSQAAAHSADTVAPRGQAADECVAAVPVTPARLEDQVAADGRGTQAESVSSPAGTSEPDMGDNVELF